MEFKVRKWRGENRIEIILDVNMVGIVNGLCLSVKKMKDLDFGLNSRWMVPMVGDTGELPLK